MTQPSESIRPRKYVVQHKPSGFFLSLVDLEHNDWRFVPSVGAAFAFHEKSEAEEEAAQQGDCAVYGVY